MPEAIVIAVQLHEEHGQPPKSVREARAILDHGLEGDSHSLHGPGRKRQVVILDESTLQQFALVSGDLREQITVRGMPDISVIPAGEKLRIGDVTFESAGECEPCTHIGGLLGVEDVEAFRQALEHRRGLLCKVVEVTNSGYVRVGNSVNIL